MGQLLLNCCEDEDETTCLGLKEDWPMTLLDSDNSTNPNYCYIRPNICTLCAAVASGLSGCSGAPCQCCTLRRGCLQPITCILQVLVTSRRLVKASSLGRG